MRTSLIAALLAAGCTIAAAAADPPGPTLIPAAFGARVHLRITQTAQGVDLPRTVTSDVIVQRKSAGAVLLERKDENGRTIDSVLTQSADGALQLSAGERDAQSDDDVRALLPLLNAALALVRAAASPGASASLAVPFGARDARTVLVPLRSFNVAGTEYDLQGSGSTALQSPGGDSSRERRGGGFSGGFAGPGGFGASGGFRRPGGPGAEPPSRTSDSGAPANAMTVLVRVDGHVSRGSVHHLAIAQTRAIEIGGAPFVNVSSSTIDVVD